MSAVAVAFAAQAASAAPGDPSAPAAHRLIDVPYLPQTPELCGGAAAAMVMRYWGDATVLPVDFQSLVSSANGILTTDLASAIARRGWQAVASEGSDDADGALRGLQHEVDVGRPVITLIEASPGRLHYVVVVGVTGDRVVFHDPARTAFRVESASDFDAEWRGGRRWRLVILPKAGSTVQPAATTGAAAGPQARSGACGALVDRGVDLANTDAAAAEQALVAAADLCNDDSDPWYELAGLRFKQSQWHAAAAFAEQAVQRTSADPERRAAWQLLATSRFLDNDFDGALDAWNHIGLPAIDVVTLSGARRSAQPPLHHLIGLEPRKILTAPDFERAARNFNEAPTAAATRLSFTPEDDGRVTVAAAMTEGDAMPHRLADLSALVGRALVSRDIRLPLSGVLGMDESLTLDYRYPAPEPRYGALLQLPAPAPFHGLVTIDGFWEQESYATPFTDLASVDRETRRRVDVNVGTWISGSTKIDFGAAADRFDSRSYAALHGGVEEHVAGDRVVARLDGETWGFSGSGFSTANATVTWRTTTEMTTSSLSGIVGGWVASANAPRFLWMGGGRGPGRPLLLRAHPLLDDSIVDSPFFGRRYAFATTEYQKPIKRTRTGVVAVAGFVDMGQAWRTLLGPGASPFQVDAGIGVRLRVSSRNGARIDLAHGVPNGDWTISAGYTYGSGVVFNRGIPW